MAGIYLHIPFCKQACHYCNFHFSTSLKYKSEMVDALLRELELRKDYLSGVPLQSIYFGGGTPSLLQHSELAAIFEAIHQYYEVAPGAEITLEANPDDLSQAKLRMLASTPVNRLSIGIQSFFEEDLQFMNRAHTAAEADTSVKAAQDIGFTNLTIDLIYGSPTTSDQQWQSNIHRTLELGVPHLSCYCLTVEPKTALAHFVKTGQAKPLDDEQASRQFIQLIDHMEQAGFLHYEISNFAKPGAEAVHNSSYWAGLPYLGIGPSAHSFKADERSWNIANNQQYMNAIKEGILPLEIEKLSPQDQFNEYIMTGLRTSKGIDPVYLGKKYAEFWQQVAPEIQAFLAKKQLLLKEGRLVLSRSGKLLADYIAASLFIVDNQN